MSKIVLAIVGGFLVVSFGFMGGWPFRAQESDPAPLRHDVKDDLAETPNPTNKNDVKPSTAESSPESLVKKPSQDAPAVEVRKNREFLSSAKGEGADAFRLALSETILDASLPWKYRQSQLRELSQLNKSTVFRPGYFSKAVDIRIGPGDSLTRIARRVKKAHGNNVTPALLMRMNHLPNTRIRAGNLISAPTESVRVVISKSDFRLYVLLGEAIILDFPVGTGRANSTPEGEFVIRGKTKNPTWTRPDGSIVRFGEEGHIIGNRWLGFANERGRTPYGIHGTVDNASIGKEESEGCIRMLKDDVEEIFRLIPEGCAVEIRP